MITFTLMLLVVSAVPVFAASPEETLEASPAATSASEAEPAVLPDEASLAEAVAQEEEKEVEREEWRASPEATSEREDSEYAYTDLTASEEEELLRASFAPRLEQLDSDPARLLSDVQLDQVFSPNEAQVTVEGEKMLLESSIPLRVPEEDGSSGRAVGLLHGRSLTQAHVRFFTPLVKPRGFSAEKVPGALHAPGMGNLHLIVAP